MSSDCLSLIDSTFPLYVASRNYYEEDEDQLEVVAQVEYIVSVGVSLPTDVRESKSLKVFELVDVKDQPEQMMIDTPYLTVLEEFLNDWTSTKNKRGIVINCVQGQSRSVFGAAYVLLKSGHSATSAMQVLLKKRRNIAVNPGFLAQLYFVERLLIRNIKEEERGKSLRVHCKVCSQLQSSSHMDDGPLLYTGEHTIDQNLLEEPFHMSLNEWVSAHCDDFWRDYRPQLVTRAKGRAQRKRKHDEEQGQEQDELLLFREPVLTPIPSSGGHGDYHYLPIRFTELAGTTPKALRCNKCRANLGVGMVKIGICGNYIVSTAMAFRKKCVFLS
jgi:hypothetical protein